MISEKSSTKLAPVIYDIIIIVMRTSLGCIVFYFVFFCRYAISNDPCDLLLSNVVSKEVSDSGYEYTIDDVELKKAIKEKTIFTFYQKNGIEVGKFSHIVAPRQVLFLPSEFDKDIVEYLEKIDYISHKSSFSGDRHYSRSGLRYEDPEVFKIKMTEYNDHIFAEAGGVIIVTNKGKFFSKIFTNGSQWSLETLFMNLAIEKLSELKDMKGLEVKQILNFHTHPPFEPFGGGHSNRTVIQSISDHTEHGKDLKNLSWLSNRLKSKLGIRYEAHPSNYRSLVYAKEKEGNFYISENVSYMWDALMVSPRQEVHGYFTY
ncbi:MAG: hypothetical protein H6621_10800 [Halobacteriovoraceae bacterium]|nr:hypothetical protein [Halobacteriovoraceae bacterium]MCB9095546.1 hypothetical protein [Halobacteriovoraceae bacterium]